MVYIPFQNAIFIDNRLGFLLAFGAGKGFQVFGGTWLVICVLLFGLANIVAQLLSRAEILPVFKG